MWNGAQDGSNFVTAEQERHWQLPLHSIARFRFPAQLVLNPMRKTRSFACHYYNGDMSYDSQPYIAFDSQTLGLGHPHLAHRHCVPTPALS